LKSIPRLESTELGDAGDPMAWLKAVDAVELVELSGFTSFIAGDAGGEIQATLCLKRLLLLKLAVAFDA
jgi:hypothetical protein